MPSMISRTILLLLSTLLLPSTQAHRPDTVPDYELRPLFPNDGTSTQAPTASIRYPIVLPLLPYTNEYEVVTTDANDDYEYYDYMFPPHHHPGHVSTEMYPATQMPGGTDEGTIVVYTVPDELDAQQEKLANSAIKNCTRWKLVIAVTALLYVISTFMLS